MAMHPIVRLNKNENSLWSKQIYLFSFNEFDCIDSVLKQVM